MKFPVSATLLAVIFASPAIGDSVDVFFMAGQSNMSGRVSTGYVADPRDSQVSYYYRTDGPFSHTEDSAGDFTTLRPLAVTGNYGPEIQVGRNLVDLGLNPAIIKVSRGSTILFPRQPNVNNWNSRSDGDWWNIWKSESLNALSKLTAAGHSVNLRGFFWLQGEADAAAEGFARQYDIHFPNFVADVSTHLSDNGYNADNLRFVTALIVDERRHADLVRSAQIATMDAIPSGDWFDTDDLTLFDGTHYDVDSVATIGDRFVSTYAAIPEPSAALLALFASGIFVFVRLPTGSSE